MKSSVYTDINYILLNNVVLNKFLVNGPNIDISNLSFFRTVIEDFIPGNENYCKQIQFCYFERFIKLRYEWIVSDSYMSRPVISLSF